MVRLAIASHYAERICEILRVKIAAKLAGFDGLVRNVIVRDQLALDAGNGADIGDFISGLLKIRDQCQIRSTVTGRSSAGQNNSFIHL